MNLRRNLLLVLRFGKEANQTRVDASQRTVARDDNQAAASGFRDYNPSAVTMPAVDWGDGSLSRDGV